MSEICLILFLLNILTTNPWNLSWVRYNVDLHQFLKELWPLTCVRISFLINILRMNGCYLTKFSICIDINEINVGIVMHKIPQIYN